MQWCPLSSWPCISSGWPPGALCTPYVGQGSPPSAVGNVAWTACFSVSSHSEEDDGGVPSRLLLIGSPEVRSSPEVPDSPEIPGLSEVLEKLRRVGGWLVEPPTILKVKKQVKLQNEPQQTDHGHLHVDERRTPFHQL